MSDHMNGKARPECPVLAAFDAARPIDGPHLPPHSDARTAAGRAHHAPPEAITGPAHATATPDPGAVGEPEIGLTRAKGGLRGVRS